MTKVAKMATVPIESEGIESNKIVNNKVSFLKDHSTTSSHPKNHPTNNIRVRALKSLTKTDRDDITDFNNLRDKITKKLTLDNWVVVTSSQNLYIFNLNRKPNGNLSIGNTISIDNDLTAKVFYDENLFDSLKLFRWPQLQTLVEQFRNNVKREDDFEFQSPSDSKTHIEFQDCYETKRELDASIFEFCAVNVEAVSADVSVNFFFIILPEFFLNLFLIKDGQWTSAVIRTYTKRHEQFTAIEN